MTERLHFLFSPSCIGEGNGNPLQCSCLENSRDGGAWWAAVNGVAQSWTWLKRPSSSSSSSSGNEHTECEQLDVNRNLKKGTVLGMQVVYFIVICCFWREFLSPKTKAYKDQTKNKNPTITESQGKIRTWTISLLYKLKFSNMNKDLYTEIYITNTTFFFFFGQGQNAKEHFDWCQEAAVLPTISSAPSVQMSA